MKTRSTRTNRRSASAFTLTELLVVILIIAVLAALSVMGVRKLRGTADKVAATRSISQLQIANAGYAADHNGRYVAVYTFDEDKQITGFWFNNASFLSNLYGDGAIIKNNIVPPSMLDPIVTRAKKRDHDKYFANFGYNQEGFSGPGTGWGNAGTVQAWRVSQVVSPERSCAFITCTSAIAKYNGRSLWKDAAAVEGKTDDGKIAYRHTGGKALVVYFDGHVGEISMKEIEQLDRHSEPSMKGKKNLFWNPNGK